jgi:dTDP-glucose 4,6-dehydratase
MVEKVEASKEKVLVTGAGGFIGSHLLPELIREGYEVIALDKPEALSRLNTEDYDYYDKINKVEADICDCSRMESLGRGLNFESQSGQKVDSIIHLAAIAAPRVAEKKPEETFRINVYGTLNVLRMAKEAHVKRVVFPSTAHVYGISPKYLPTDESHPLALQDDYTISKILGEQLCRLFYENHNISYVALRMFNGYGPRQSLDYFIPAMIEQTKKGNITLRGRYITKDFIYVADMVDAILTVLPSEYVGSLNVGTGQQVALEYVADYIAEAFKVKLKFAEPDDKGPTHMQCDNSRLRGFGWSPKVSIEEGLDKTIEYEKAKG